MRSVLTLSLALAYTGLQAQEDAAIGGRKAMIATVDALREAGTDEARDSLNSALKTELRKVLDADDAATISLEDIPLGHVDAPDGRFRLITWNYPLSDGSYRYEGFLLVTDNKRNTLFELMDRTAEIGIPENAELGPERWYGALYYDVLPVKKGGKTYYTLLGWKGHSKIETQKVIEVLSFRGKTPRFGAALFDGAPRLMRRIFAYSFQVKMSLRADQEQARIVFDHLSPIQLDLKGQAAFTGPDLSYDAYQWEKGRFLFERDIDARERDRSGKPYHTPPKER